MKKITNYIILFLIFNSVMKVELYAQPSFSVDSSFTPLLDFTMNTVSGGGVVNDIWENTKNGNIYIVGGFNQTYNGVGFRGNVCYTVNGSMCPNYRGEFGTDLAKIFSINDSVLVVTKSGFVRQVDLNGTPINLTIIWNLFKSIPCRDGIDPYFYSDGSFIMPNSYGNTATSCRPINGTDTFPHSYIVKVNPQGLYDSTFQHTMNNKPTSFIPYDSSRFFIYGYNTYFTQYDGHTVNGLCRVFLNGDLDTTFDNPIVPGNTNYGIGPVEKDGKFFLYGGNFSLKDHPGKTSTLARFNSDGSLDTTFMNFYGSEDTTSNVITGINALVKTEDNGYLVAGYFNKYQGFVKNGFVKLDSTGKIEPQYFNNFIGPDSSITRFGSAGIRNMKKSVNGGYYVYGNWKSWDGKHSQPIIKLHGLTNNVGLEEKKQVAKTQLIQTIYPNPTHSMVHLEWLPNQVINQIQVLDFQGRIVQNFNQKVNQINLEQLESGIYFLKAVGEDGMDVKKIVKR